MPGGWPPIKGRLGILEPRASTVWLVLLLAGKPEIVGFGSSVGAEMTYCRSHPQQVICMLFRQHRPAPLIFRGEK